MGKGLENRPSSKRRNHKWHAIVKRLGLRVEICVEFKCDDHDHKSGEKCPANEEACAWEIENIALMNTFSMNHSHDDIDIMCNFTRGGDGMTGYRASDEMREKQREAAKHRPSLAESTHQALRAARARQDMSKHAVSMKGKNKRPRPDLAIKNRARKGTQVRCSKCGEMGHNRRGCHE